MSIAIRKDKYKPFPIKNGKTTFGMHFMLDAYGVPFEQLNDMKLIFKYLNDLPSMIGMRKLTSPVVLDCDSTDSGKDPGGISGVVIIAESHVSIHTFARRGFFTMDLYSCSDFAASVDEILEYTKVMFPWAEHRLQVVERGLDYPMDNR